MINESDNNMAPNIDLTVSSIYESIKSNIKAIMSDPVTNDMLDPNHNTVTQKCLRDNDEEDDAYSVSYLVTLLLVLDLYGIPIWD
ncbi:MAG: hypothetical protein Barrevirus16_8 [Barrevirus sp.]|uniref:Uncharacterized protein n=1 Tax=Barrevirus sp. TaxID=2487763 RepID=A0A3G4ZQJ0_9VIRU|nr:MAG: hypothetical protein Barrevirus16_8 [Barrevirus sp.]